MKQRSLTVNVKFSEKLQESERGKRRISGPIGPKTGVKKKGRAKSFNGYPNLKQKFGSFL